MPRKDQKYPWDLWLDGAEHRLVPGVDFERAVRQMRKQVQTAALYRGLRVSTTIAADGCLVVQAQGGGSPVEWAGTPEGPVRSHGEVARILAECGWTRRGGGPIRAIDVNFIEKRALRKLREALSPHYGGVEP